MEQLNKNFSIPYYIFEEVINYIELSAKGYCKSMKWENIKALINLAVINNQLTKDQADMLKETYCRE